MTQSNVDFFLVISTICTRILFLGFRVVARIRNKHLPHLFNKGVGGHTSNTLRKTNKFWPLTYHKQYNPLTYLPRTRYVLFECPLRGKRSFGEKKTQKSIFRCAIIQCHYLNNTNCFLSGSIHLSAFNFRNSVAEIKDLTIETKDGSSSSWEECFKKTIKKNEISEKTSPYEVNLHKKLLFFSFISFPLNLGGRKLKRVQ